MDPNWPQRHIFKRLVKEYRASNGLDRPAMAQLLGVEESHLHGLLYDKRTRATLDLVKKAAAIFGCSITELVDDPGATIEGEPMADTSALRRYVAGAMAQDVKASDLTDEDVRMLHEDHQRALERIRAMKARMNKTP